MFQTESDVSRQKSSKAESVLREVVGVFGELPSRLQGKELLCKLNDGYKAAGLDPKTLTGFRVGSTSISSGVVNASHASCAPAGKITGCRLIRCQSHVAGYSGPLDGKAGVATCPAAWRIAFCVFISAPVPCASGGSRSGCHRVASARAPVAPGLPATSFAGQWPHLSFVEPSLHPAGWFLNNSARRGLE